MVKLGICLARWVDCNLPLRYTRLLWQVSNMAHSSVMPRGSCMYEVQRLPLPSCCTAASCPLGKPARAVPIHLEHGAPACPSPQCWSTLPARACSGCNGGRVINPITGEGPIYGLDNDKPEWCSCEHVSGDDQYLLSMPHCSRLSPF